MPALTSEQHSMLKRVACIGVVPHLKINVLGCWHILEMHLQDLLAPLDIWVGHCDMAIKAPRSDERFVQ